MRLRQSTHACIRNLVQHERDAECSRKRGVRDIVVGRSDAAAGDDEVVCGAQTARALGNGISVVGDGLDALEGLGGRLAYSFMRNWGLGNARRRGRNTIWP